MLVLSPRWLVTINLYSSIDILRHLHLHTSFIRLRNLLAYLRQRVLSTGQEGKFYFPVLLLVDPNAGNGIYDVENTNI